MVRVTRGTMVNCCLCSSLEKKKKKRESRSRPESFSLEIGAGEGRVQGYGWVVLPLLGVVDLRHRHRQADAFDKATACNNSKYFYLVPILIKVVLDPLLG